MKEALIKTVVPLLHAKGGKAGLRWWQNHLLRRTIQHASQHSPFYRRKFAELGLSPQIVRTAEDLPKLGFFTTPKDLQADPFDFLAVPKEDCVHIMSTSGTTGKPKTTFYSKRDWETMVGKIHSGLILVDTGPEEVCQIMLCSGTPTWMGGTLLQAGLERRGCLIVPLGNALSPKAQLDAMAQFGSTYLFCTPSYMHRVTQEGRKLADLKSFGIKRIYLGSEPCSKEFRNYLEEVWGAQVYDGYGMMEFGAGIGGECTERDGIHLDLFIIAEVIDPTTAKPLGIGEEGELVFTSIGRAASPLLRYRSGDIARLLPEGPCHCGTLPTRKISNILGRTDDMIFLGTGENFTPVGLDQLMVTIADVAGYQLVVGKNGYRDTLLLRIETSLPSPDFAKQIIDRLYQGIPFLLHDVQQSQTIAEPTIEFLKPGTLQSQSPIKIHRVVDIRQ